MDRYFSTTLEEVENYLDYTLSRLPIFRLPINIALINCLTEIESEFQLLDEIHDHLSFQAAMLQLKAALQFLIPLVFKHCSNSRIVPTKENALQFLNSANQAINFCESVSSLEECFLLFHTGYFEGSLDDRIVTFSYPKGTDFGRAELNLTLHTYHEERRLQQSAQAGIFPPTTTPHEFKISLDRAIEKFRGNILYSIPQIVYFPVREIIKASMPTGSSLHEIIAYLIESQKRMSDDIEQKICVLQIKVGGYLVKMPGYGNFSNSNVQHDIGKTFVGRTSPCPCGSGLKYKDCCKPLEVYQDDNLC
jgi:hypothetical protein